MIKAVIFDMDGLMFDTERLWLDSVAKTNEVYGYNVPEELIIECMGNRKDKIDEILISHMGPDFDPQRFRELNNLFMDEDVKNHGLRKKKGLDELLNFLKQTDLKLAVASSSSERKVNERFEQSGVNKDCFDVILCGNQITKPKPAPEIYKRICKLLSVKPEEAIALEDSENGLLSAINAGVKAVWIPDIKMPRSEVIRKVYRKFDSLDQVIELFKQKSAKLNKNI